MERQILRFWLRQNDEFVRLGGHYFAEPVWGSSDNGGAGAARLPEIASIQYCNGAISFSDGFGPEVVAEIG